jgi:endonuclease III
MALNFHGRYVCTARNPACFRCPISDLCLFEEKSVAPQAGDIP